VAEPGAEALTKPIKMTQEQKADSIAEKAIQYAATNGEGCKPEVFTERQVGLLHGFIDGAQWMAEALNGDKWISVKDRLPEKDGDSQIFCLVWDTYEGHAVVRPYNEYHKCWDGEDADDFYTDATEGNITHWMPLPSKPQK
jgi:hypothetical protein